MPTDAGPYIHFKLNLLSGIEAHIEKTYPGLDMAPRAIEDALRRGHLKFYQFGQRRYVTPKRIDEWLQSCVTASVPA